MKTQDEIMARVEARKGGDFFGFEISEYIAFLDFEHAKQFLKEGVEADGWEVERFDALPQRMKDYMTFAFEKANDQRGISANRSILHYIAWTWLNGDVEFSDEIDRMYRTNYRYYGKAILVHICEKYGWDWKALDDNRWANSESDSCTSQEAIGK